MINNCFSIREVNFSKGRPNWNIRISSVLLILAINVNRTACNALNNPIVTANYKSIDTIVQVAIIILRRLSLN